MTAYGFGESRSNDYQYTCEIRTLNSRFLETNVRMPRQFLPMESDIIALVKKSLDRGKCDLFIDVQREGGSKDLPDLDPSAIEHYATIFTQAQTQLSTRAGAVRVLDPNRLPGVMDYLRLEGVMQSDRTRERGQEVVEKHKDALFGAVKSAIESVKTARGKEGTSLQGAMTDLVKQLESDRATVQEKRDSILSSLHENFLKRLRSVIETIDKNTQTGQLEFNNERILQEVAILSDKADIEEELIRLKTHNEEFLKHLIQQGPVGRKLDFLCQEMHREVNTMSNKLTQTEVSQYTVNMKQTIERLRQQVQNIE
jgi:uncharacterized protein (TIGR00255 family)